MQARRVGLVVAVMVTLASPLWAFCVAPVLTGNGTCVSPWVGPPNCMYSPAAHHAVVGTLTGSTTTLGKNEWGSCGFASQDAPEAVYSWTAPVAGVVTVSTCSPKTDFDTTLYVREGTCADGFEVACNDDGCPGKLTQAGTTVASKGSTVTFTADADETYFFIVDGFSGQAKGTYELRARFQPAGSYTTTTTTSTTTTTL